MDVKQQKAANKMVKKYGNKRNKRTLQFELYEPMSVLTRAVGSTVLQSGTKYSKKYLMVLFFVLVLSCTVLCTGLVLLSKKSTKKFFLVFVG